MERGTKERILDEALKLFSQKGYLGTSMSDIAAKLGITKGALYKHYTSKQEILDSIIARMNQMDLERAKAYEMPEGKMEELVAGYQAMPLERIREYTEVQFLHWTQEDFSSAFRKMLTLEQYRDPEMAKLYQNYLAGGPIDYMEALFSGLTGNDRDAKQLALEFYGPIYLLYSLYDAAEDRQAVVEMVKHHVEQFSRLMEEAKSEGGGSDAG